ncbi:hypothetical protein B0H11DRAFT_1724989 [Mycena galericulata]|nr:hypothetical protein B0H11DRAFT_1752661 [Mycena galericulata]KAJ7480338.1 hypothetical protein B0H11DRAFT_1724989 [Mycena galericulata]
MTGSHAQQNAEIILVLSKMGIYMERDRKRLDCLSPAAQNTRLKKALDRAVENCCIFPLMFSKETREMGNLVLSDLPEWAGWRTSRKEILHASLFILHFVDRPNSFGILMQKQTGRVGNMMMMPYDIHNIDANMASGDVDNTAIFEAVVAIIKRSEKDKAEAAYFWATRKGDCVEVDLVDLPDQALGW